MIEFRVGDQVYNLLPGDMLDLGKHGLLVFYAHPEAEGVRIFQEEGRRRVREAVRFARDDERKRMAQGQPLLPEGNEDSPQVVVKSGPKLQD